MGDTLARIRGIRIAHKILIGKCGETMWNGLIWLRTGISEGFL